MAEFHAWKEKEEEACMVTLDICCATGMLIGKMNHICDTSIHTEYASKVTFKGKYTKVTVTTGLKVFCLLIKKNY